MNNIKKSLLALGLTGLVTFNAGADKIKLSDEFARGDPVEITQVVGNDYENPIKVTAQAHNKEYIDAERPDATRDLTFAIKDKSTCVFIIDKDADELNDDDNLTLSHDFPNGDKLFLRIAYEGEDYDIESQITYSDGSVVSGDVKTKDLIKPVRYLAKREMKPIVEWGNKMYKGLVNSANNGEPSNLPYEKVRTALKNAHKDIELLKDSKSTSLKALTKIADEYTKLITEK